MRDCGDSISAQNRERRHRPQARRAGLLRGANVVVLLLVVSGLVFLTAPYIDDSRFVALTHVSGRIEAVQRVSLPDGAHPSVYVTLSAGSGRRRLRIDTFDWHPSRLARLSIGRVVDVWVDDSPPGTRFVWQVESEGEVLVGYRDRLEFSRHLQHRMTSIGWVLLGGGIFLCLYTLWRARRI